MSISVFIIYFSSPNLFSLAVTTPKLHDLRHSHISLLIEMGFSAVAIADRVGHESIDITYRYAHLFPSTQNEMADRLSKMRSDDAEGGEDDVSKES